jgi:hypothetical protein
MILSKLKLCSKYTGPRTKEIIIEIPTDDPDFMNDLERASP